MFLMATLANGRRVVSEFTKLSKAQKYVNGVFAGTESFNAWKVISRIHPSSGEVALIREREFISGQHIVSIQQVEPIRSDHEYDPNLFKPLRLTKEGEYGLWRVPAGTVVEVDGVIATPDFDYPVHRDNRSLRDYVILRVANEADGIAEVRWYTDGDAAPVQPGPGEEEHVGSWDDDDTGDDESGY